MRTSPLPSSTASSRADYGRYILLSIWGSFLREPPSRAALVPPTHPWACSNWHSCWLCPQSKSPYRTCIRWLELSKAQFLVLQKEYPRSLKDASHAKATFCCLGPSDIASLPPPFSTQKYPSTGSDTCHGCWHACSGCISELFSKPQPKQEDKSRNAVSSIWCLYHTFQDE